MATNDFGGKVGEESIDAAWVILCAFIVFTMQSGFGLLESGLVSRKSEANVMVKNMLDVTVGGVVYWVVGYGFSFGPNSGNADKMAGNGHFVLDLETKDGFQYAHYFFQLSFATAATTIVSGAVAERVKLTSYMIFAILNTGFIYVVPVHWIWTEGGWLSGKTIDFAGSCVVHMAGGISGLMGAIALGPRYGRFDGRAEYRMASATNVVLGAFFLWWGWIGFNCGSTFAVTNGTWLTASRVAVVTMNGAMGGGTGAVLLNFILKIKRDYLLDIPELVSGILGGLVSITACASVIRPWEALIIGFIGGMLTIGGGALLAKLKIDDPVGCFPVHFMAGFWSMIATSFFAENNPSEDLTGIFRGGNGKLLGYNLAACVTVTLWNGGLSALVFLVLKYTIGLRMDEEEEIRGSDEVEHNVKDQEVAKEGNHALGKHIFGSVTYKNSNKKPQPNGIENELAVMTEK